MTECAFQLFPRLRFLDLSNSKAESSDITSGYGQKNCKNSIKKDDNNNMRSSRICQDDTLTPMSRVQESVKEEEDGEQFWQALQEVKSSDENLSNQEKHNQKGSSNNSSSINHNKTVKNTTTNGNEYDNPLNISPETTLGNNSNSHYLSPSLTTLNMRYFEITSKSSNLLHSMFNQPNLIELDLHGSIYSDTIAMEVI